MNRKDEHLALAKAFYREQKNDFDAVRFVHHSLKGISVANVDLRTKIGKLELSCPFYLNAMTGGSLKTAQVNRDLGIIARETGLLIATGSVNAALKNPELWESFRVVRQENPQGLVLANVGAGVSLEAAQQAVAGLAADGLQVHLNVPQELVMPEGDRDFSEWEANLVLIAASLDVPVIVKEVGFGMSRETVERLAVLGVEIADVSGRGGTSFTQIENARRSQREFDYLADWGQSAVVSLLEAQEAAVRPGVLLASGGVRQALDIFKCLCLGAQAVGVSGTILNTLLTDGVAKTIQLIQRWQQELRTLFALVGAENLAELQKTQLLFEGAPKSWCESRNIDLKKYSLR